MASGTREKYQQNRHFRTTTASRALRFDPVFSRTTSRHTSIRRNMKAANEANRPAIFSQDSLTPCFPASADPNNLQGAWGKVPSQRLQPWFLR